MNNKKEIEKSMNETLINFINNVLPNKEELENIQNKLNNNEELSSYDGLILKKIEIFNLLKNISERR